MGDGGGAVRSPGATSRPALWNRARPAALGIARDSFVKGMDADDIRQEALLALWVASGTFDPARGPWMAYARMCVKAHLSTLVEAATRQKRTAVTVELDSELVGAPDRDDGGLADVLASMHVLTGKERAALAAHLNGTAARSSKAHETALYRARRKLREAA